ncbi:MAG: hypothetical protein Udaeo2_30570 [Candidatus Udaeobacter sp.]|nr:MAG: hypothetical protein Udaeo2_30570 [Candidatus Udaeobacter sp.]
MTAVSKKTRIITRSRYSAWICCGKENAAVRVARIKSQAAKPHSFANALRTTRSTLSKVDRLLLNASPARTDGKWVPAEGARSIKTFQTEGKLRRAAGQARLRRSTELLLRLKNVNA